MDNTALPRAVGETRANRSVAAGFGKGSNLSSTPNYPCATPLDTTPFSIASITLSNLASMARCMDGPGYALSTSLRCAIEAIEEVIIEEVGSMHNNKQY